jgi:hypothetical protein
MTYFVEGLIKRHSGQHEVRRIGEYETLDDAVRASEQTIDGYLQGMSEPEMAAADLFSKFENFGEVHFIFRDGDETLHGIGFNYYKYAMIRCGSICGRKQGASAN